MGEAGIVSAAGNSYEQPENVIKLSPADIKNRVIEQKTGRLQMNDPMLTDVFIITSSFIAIMVVLVVSVLTLERAGWP